MHKQIFIDPINRNNSHLYFNTKSILNDQKSGNKMSTILISEESLCKNINRILTDIKGYRVKGTKANLLIIKTYITLLSHKRKYDKITFLCLDNTIIPFLLLSSSFIFRNNKIIIYIHNNIDTLLNNRLKRLLHTLMLYFVEPEVVLITEKMHEEYITLFPKARTKLIPHYNYADVLEKIYPNTGLLDSKKCNISIVGRQAKLFRKNEMEKIAKMRFRTVQVNFFGISKIVDNDGLFFFEEKLKDNDYFSVIQNSDFVLFADDITSINRASGVLMDTISLKTPFIAPNYGHYQEYAKFDVGLLYNDYDELLDILRKVEINRIKPQDFVGFNRALLYSS